MEKRNGTGLEEGTRWKVRRVKEGEMKENGSGGKSKRKMERW